jgi:hypothetical protein
MALGSAVQQGIIANETLAYFIGRTWLFFCRAGVDPKRMRFRQHLQHEVGCRVVRQAAFGLGGVAGLVDGPQAAFGLDDLAQPRLGWGYIHVPPWGGGVCLNPVWAKLQDATLASGAGGCRSGCVLWGCCNRHLGEGGHVSAADT